MSLYSADLRGDLLTHRSHLPARLWHSLLAETNSSHSGPWAASQTETTRVRCIWLSDPAEFCLQSLWNCGLNLCCSCYCSNSFLKPQADSVNLASAHFKSDFPSKSPQRRFWRWRWSPYSIQQYCSFPSRGLSSAATHSSNPTFLCPRRTCWMSRCSRHTSFRLSRHAPALSAAILVFLFLLSRAGGLK